MKNGIFSKLRKEQSSEAVVFAILGLIGFATVGVALLASTDFVREEERVIAHLSGNSTNDTDRWRAECRTWAAMIRYVFEAEPEPLTSLDESNQCTSARTQHKVTNSTPSGSRPLG